MNLTSKSLVLLTLAGIIFQVKLLGQEKQGISASNYLSTSGIFLNPTASVDSKTYVQLNLLGAGVFVMSNSVYIPNFSVYNHKNEPFINNVQLSTLKLPKFLYANATVDGPAFIISKGNYGGGFFVRARSVVSGNIASAQAMSALITQENTTGADAMNVNLKNTRAASMSWLEYGGNFGMIVKRDRKNLWSVAANLRYISGINLMYANITQLKGSYNDSMITVETLSGKLRYTDIALNAGKGVGADLGVTYKRMLSDANSYYPNTVRCNCKTLDYKYKVGVALRDVGAIRFKKGASSANVNTSGEYYTGKNDTTYQSAIASVINTPLSNKAILASLPTALVGQFDWNFENNFFVSTTLIKDIMPNGLTGVQSANLLAIAPRYETMQFEVSTPITFQRYLYPQVGLALRYRTFAIGVDNVFPLVVAKKTYGMGIYFSAGISLFKNPACRTKHRRVDRCPVKNLNYKGRF